MPRTLAPLLPTPLSATTLSAAPVAPKAIETAAHDVYVNALNSDDLDTLMTDLTKDVAYQSPREPEIAGKAAVRAWAAACFASVRTHWEKTSIGFTVSGEWAFERYHYESTDPDRNSGNVTQETGKGIDVFHRGSDGRWRVAVDGWSSDRAAES